MNTLTVKAIVLSRTDYSEADRILVVLTDTAGVEHVLAKGVRKIKSKMAGGIELFAVNELTMATGRSDLKTLVSSRMHTAYEYIIKDINRTMIGYEILRFLYKQIEQSSGSDYFTLLRDTLEGLNNPAMRPELVSLWFYLQYLALAGMQPDLTHDTNGDKLNPQASYGYIADEGQLQPSSNGTLGADHIKLVRFLLAYPLAATARLRIEHAIIDECAIFVRQAKQV